MVEITQELLDEWLKLPTKKGELVTIAYFPTSEEITGKIIRLEDKYAIVGHIGQDLAIFFNDKINHLSYLGPTFNMDSVYGANSADIVDPVKDKDLYETIRRDTMSDKELRKYIGH